MTVFTPEETTTGRWLVSVSEGDPLLDHMTTAYVQVTDEVVLDSSIDVLAHAEGELVRGCEML